ncbi:hypothetical protein M407DRAFT_184509 [Tulasnella calospora MUT 4182]|uniref:Uncharacterized protein n=1 Tax=Tulasnella calospora MUT 4182 TaxID=1051891 RepID=A0A0C3L4U5_9AGAM|nr:hypothetical protein M407DRAFT_184509 [Tulasnella calospora MUT 4182]
MPLTRQEIGHSRVSQDIYTVSPFGESDLQSSLPIRPTKTSPGREANTGARGIGPWLLQGVRPANAEGARDGDRSGTSRTVKPLDLNIPNRSR